MLLNELVSKLEYKSLLGNIDVSITGLNFDSRAVKKGNLFIAISGVHVDGHNFIESSINNGCVAVVCEVLPRNILEGICYIQVKDSSVALGVLSSIYYENPSSKINIVGVTGTNGKTTIATLLYELYREAGYKVGLLSTVANFINEKELKSTHTTPDVLSINKLLKEMIDCGCEYCFMEVSSHAIDQNRVSNICFKGGIFTNITHDHLDYHKTFAEYIKVKKKFFDNLPNGSFSITNIDDKNGLIMLQNTHAEKKTYSIRSIADYKARVIESHFTGMLMEINGREVWTSLIGAYNASNILAVYGAAESLGMSAYDILKYISGLKPVAGRLETVLSKDGIMGIVDYAHTPDALKNVLENITNLKKSSQSIISVVGAGGERDKAKRPEMAKIAAIYSDKLILTSDNPRSENPSDIIEDMKNGLSKDALSKTISIIDRKEAIRTSILLANKGDIVLVAGKGHENYQEINGVRTHFDDKEIIEEIFNN